jgi:hypothetical protein
MYLRFVLPNMNPDTGLEDGVFELAYEIRREGDLSEHEREELGDLLRWFGDNLQLPDRFNRTRSKGYYRRATKTIIRSSQNPSVIYGTRPWPVS